MKKYFVMGVLILNIAVVNSYAEVEDGSVKFKASAIEPVRGSVSSEDARADRAAKLKARIKAIEEGGIHPKRVAAPVPLYRKNVVGADQIKAKEKLSKDAGKRGTAKLKSYIHAIFGGFTSPEMAKYIAEHGRSKGNSASMKGMSFQARLKLELEKKRKRNEAKKRAIAERFEKRYKNTQ